MASYLIGLHAGLGELGAIAFLWVLIEMMSPTPERVKRAKIVALIGVIALFLSWFVGGYYYVNTYGSEVKPIIKGGPQPWSHLIFTETKEHVFLFLPFLGILNYAIIRKYEKELVKNKNISSSVRMISLLITILAFGMALMGYLISSGARSALEVLA